MLRVLVPLAQGFEDLEAITITDLLTRAEIEVTTAGLDENPVRASRGTTVTPDTSLDKILDQQFDLIVLPGGQPGANNLEKDARIREILIRHFENDKMIAAICAAPKVLASAGLLKGKVATSFPGALDDVESLQISLSQAPVVVDGNIITSRGPGTAIDFTLKLIELLDGVKTKDKVEAQLVRESS